MLKRIVIICICLLLLLYMILPSIGFGSEADVKKGVFVLPSNLAVIDDSAFEGVSGVEIVYTTEALSYVADDAFDAELKLTVYGVDDSYASEWAEQHRYEFVSYKLLYLLPAENCLKGNALQGTFIKEACAIIILLLTRFEMRRIKSRLSPKLRPEINVFALDFP